MSEANGKVEHHDTIIIGSGAGGLGAAICLARAGQKVLVLEQHDVPGGWCHSFFLNGHRFSPGVHYIGLLEEGESSDLLYRGLGIADDLVFFRQNPQAFEHAWIGGSRVDLPATYKAMIESLSKRFPAEKKNIEAYLDLVEKVAKELEYLVEPKGLWAKLMTPFKTKNFGKHATKSLRKMIHKYVDDPILRGVLAIQCGDHGMPPARTNFVLHCALMQHYSSGGFYPMGGGAGIVKAKTKKFKSLGGEIRTQQMVEKILLQGSKKKKAVGVQLASGQKLYAQNVISNADPGKTYLDLVGAENLSNRFVRKLNKAKYSCTSLMLFLTVDLDVRKAGLDSGNIWLMREADLDNMTDEMMRKDVENGHDFPGMFISCTTLKDPLSFDGQHHSLEAITYIDYSSFERFSGEGEERSQEYLDFKKRLIEKMLNTVEKVIPEIRDHIVHCDLGTPITNEYYVNSTRGSVYGTEKSFSQIGPFAFKPKGQIDNLLLCGASIHAHGVAGSAYSGVMTASEILGVEYNTLLEHDGSQKIRIYESEKDGDYPEWMQRKIEMKRSRREKASV